MSREQLRRERDEAVRLLATTEDRLWRPEIREFLAQMGSLSHEDAVDYALRGKDVFQAERNVGIRRCAEAEARAQELERERDEAREEADSAHVLLEAAEKRWSGNENDLPGVPG